MLGVDFHCDSVSIFMYNTFGTEGACYTYKREATQEEHVAICSLSLSLSELLYS
jgi:hypothetical protein